MLRRAARSADAPFFLRLFCCGNLRQEGPFAPGPLPARAAGLRHENRIPPFHSSPVFGTNQEEEHGCDHPA